MESKLKAMDAVLSAILMSYFDGGPKTIAGLLDRAEAEVAGDDEAVSVIRAYRAKIAAGGKAAA